MHAEDPGYSTHARGGHRHHGHRVGRHTDLGPVTLGVVPVAVTNTVTGYLRRTSLSAGARLRRTRPAPQHLPTVAVMYTITPEALSDNGIDPVRIPGSLHAAEHAAIGLLPLVASCDRGDIGGLSTAVGPGGLPTVFVYDGHPGGAGFADRGYQQAAVWLGATLDAISACECPNGCPSCVQSPNAGTATTPWTRWGDRRATERFSQHWRPTDPSTGGFRDECTPRRRALPKATRYRARRNGLSRRHAPNPASLQPFRRITRLSTLISQRTRRFATICAIFRSIPSFRAGRTCPRNRARRTQVQPALGPGPPP